MLTFKERSLNCLKVLQNQDYDNITLLGWILNHQIFLLSNRNTNVIEGLVRYSVCNRHQWWGQFSVKVESLQAFKN